MHAKGFPTKIRSGVLVVDDAAMLTIDSITQTTEDKMPRRIQDSSDFHNHVTRFANDHYESLPHTDDIEGTEVPFDNHEVHLCKDDEGNTYFKFKPRDSKHKGRDNFTKPNSRQRQYGIQPVGGIFGDLGELQAYNKARWAVEENS
jgi:hypothetical protein